MYVLQHFVYSFSFSFCMQYKQTQLMPENGSIWSYKFLTITFNKEMLNLLGTMQSVNFSFIRICILIIQIFKIWRHMQLLIINEHSRSWSCGPVFIVSRLRSRQYTFVQKIIHPNKVSTCIYRVAQKKILNFAYR